MLPQLSEDKHACYFSVRRGNDNYRHYVFASYSHFIIMKWWNVHPTAHRYSTLGSPINNISSSWTNILSSKTTCNCPATQSSQTHRKHDAKPKETNSKILTTFQWITPENLLYTKMLYQCVLEWEFEIMYFFTKMAGIKSYCHRIFCINNFNGAAADGGTQFIVLILNSRGLDWTATGLWNIKAPIFPFFWRVLHLVVTNIYCKLSFPQWYCSATLPIRLKCLLI